MSLINILKPTIYIISGLGADKRMFQNFSFEGFEVVHIDRHGLCPAEFEHYNHQQSHYVNVLYRVKGQPSCVLSGVVSQLVRNQTVTKFMEGYTQKSWNHGYKYVRQRRPVKTGPNCF